MNAENSYLQPARLQMHSVEQIMYRICLANLVSNVRDVLTHVFSHHYVKIKTKMV